MLKIRQDSSPAVPLTSVWTSQTARLVVQYSNVRPRGADGGAPDTEAPAAAAGRARGPPGAARTAREHHHQQAEQKQKPARGPAWPGKGRPGDSRARPRGMAPRRGQRRGWPPRRPARGRLGRGPPRRLDAGAGRQAFWCLSC